MEKDSIEEAIGFEMNNLKNFPFSGFPIGAQLGVIDELRVKEKLELFNVMAGFRGYFTRNGPFGRHVDSIGVYLEEEHQHAAIQPIGEDEYPIRSNLSYNQKKLLLRKIRSCAKFFIGSEYHRCMGHVISNDETANYFADCFENLCVVSGLLACNLETPIFRDVLTAFQFEVTDWAWLVFGKRSLSGEKDCSENNEFLKSYLDKQLKNCKMVGIIHRGETEKVLEEIPGFQLVEDPNKIQEIFDAFKNFHDEDCFDEPFFSEIKCFRRKIGQNELGFVLNAKDSDIDDADDYE